MSIFLWGLFALFTAAAITHLQQICDPHDQVPLTPGGRAFCMLACTLIAFGILIEGGII